MSVATRLGRYRIGERIGTGGVADVYRAQVEGAAGFAKTLVVKCLRPHVAAEPELVDALAREAKLAQRLHHGNIVQVFDFGVQDDQPYVVMEHVDGCSLYELLRDMAGRGQPLGLEEALFVIEELCAALRYVHGLTDEDGAPLHLVHRDVKPRNVLVSREGVVKLTDFGIAKVSGDRDDTLPGVIKGTPAYLSPEQAMSRGVDARTDVFALGLVLRDVLGDGLELELPVDPRVDDALADIAERASADEPAARYPDVSTMLRALQRWRTDHDVDAHPGQLAAWVRRARGQVPKAVPRKLDAALLGLGTDSLDSTRPGTPKPHTTRPGLAETAQERPRVHPGFLALAAAFATGGVLWAVMAGGSSAPSAPTPTAPSPTTSGPPPTPVDAPASSSGPATQEPPPDSTSNTNASTTEAPSETAKGTTAAPATASASETTTSPSTPSRPPRPKARTGRLVINLLPWAEVTIDGRPYGRVPIDAKLPAGRHRVRLHNPQLGDVTKVVQVKAGQTHTLNKW